MYVIRVKDELFIQKFVTQLYPVLAPTLTESLDNARFWFSYRECSAWLNCHLHMEMLFYSEIVRIA